MCPGPRDGPPARRIHAHHHCRAHGAYDSRSLRARRWLRAAGQTIVVRTRADQIPRREARDRTLMAAGLISPSPRMGKMLGLKERLISTATTVAEMTTIVLTTTTAAVGGHPGSRGRRRQEERRQEERRPEERRRPRESERLSCDRIGLESVRIHHGGSALDGVRGSPASCRERQSTGRPKRRHRHRFYRPVRRGSRGERLHWIHGFNWGHRGLECERPDHVGRRAVR